MEVGTCHFIEGPQSLSPNYDVDAYMATHFGGEVRFGTCVESWVEQKTKPNSQHMSHELYLLQNIIKS